MSWLSGCGRPAPAPAPVLAGPAEPETTIDAVVLGDYPGLRHVIRVTPHVLCGAAPEGDPGFRSLQKLGVTLVVSVDGADPDIVRQSQYYPLRYAHVPVGYDGVPGSKAAHLAGLFEAMEGKGLVYVHCYHGRHRGPAAVAAALRCLDRRIPPGQARDFLRLAGTDPKYAGLYLDATNYNGHRTFPMRDFPDRWPPAVAHVSFMVKAMVAMDRQWERVQEIRAADWKTPARRSDWEPAHEVLMLREYYRDAIRQSDREGHFDAMLETGEKLAGELEDELRIKPNPARRESLFRQLAENCSGCHETFRDRPK